MITLEKVKHAAEVLGEVARKTDLIYSPAMSGENQIYLKTENLQVTGSFKLRGAYYKISQLSDSEKQKGIVACSAGNHAQGVALASQKNNLPCVICMPDGAPISKVEATKSYGAEVCLVKDTYDDAYAKAMQIVAEEGRTLIHPFDDPDVIAGQGTIGLEILEQLEDVDAIIVPVGGGGLLSGVAYAVKAINPNIKVYGVQAAGAPSMYNSFKAGEKQSLTAVSTFADGIAVKVPGDNTYSMISKYVDDMAVVSEDEIAAAILTMIEKQKIVAEGAGAVSVAAALYNKFDLHGKKVVCVVSGGNIDVNILNRVITRGLIMSGRRSSLTITLVDKPGQLHNALEIISRCGANILEIHHNSSDPDMPINSCYVKIDMETRDSAQVELIKEEFKKSGIELVG